MAQSEPVFAAELVPCDGSDHNVHAGELRYFSANLVNNSDVAWPEAHLQLVAVSAGLQVNTPIIPLPLLDAKTAVTVAGIQVQVNDIVEGDDLLVIFEVVSSVPNFSGCAILPLHSARVEEEWVVPSEPEPSESSEPAASCSFDNPTPKEHNTEQQISMEVMGHVHHFMTQNGKVDYDEGIPTSNMGVVSELEVGQSWLMELILRNNGDSCWPKDAQLCGVYGHDFGVSEITLTGSPVQPGEIVSVTLGLTKPDETRDGAWVLGTSDRQKCCPEPIYLTVQ